MGCEIETAFRIIIVASISIEAITFRPRSKS